MTKEPLKVSDLVSFKKADYKLCKVTIDALDVLTQEYAETIESTPPQELEKIKKKFMAQLATLTDLYAKVKAFKGDGHIYLADARKEFKAEALRILTQPPSGSTYEAVKITEAKETVYASKHYKDRIHLTEQIRKFFVKVDERHAFFNTVLSALSQSISIASKDYEFNRYSKA